MQKSIVSILFVLTAAIVALLGTIVYQNFLRDRPQELKAAFHAVLLTNGQVFFGRLENLGKPYPVLKDVFYIQSQVNPETKQTTVSLVKRGKELHGPESMILNANTIVIIEPVGENSAVAKLLAEQKSRPQ
jgi:hypothetical protein